MSQDSARLTVITGGPGSGEDQVDRRVFIAPPWPEIFTQDSERKQSLHEAERTYDAMIRTYAECGYDLIELPRGPVETRLKFVLNSDVAVKA